MLITQGCFQDCWALLTQCQGLSCFSHHPTRLGVHKKLGGDTARTADPNWPKGYSMPYGVMLSNINLGEEEGRGGCLESWCLSSQVTITHDGALLSWRWLNTCLPTGSSEWIPCFALLVRTAFALPIKLSLSQPMSFLTFTLLILSPIPLGEREGVAVWCLVFGWG